MSVSFWKIYLSRWPLLQHKAMGQQGICKSCYSQEFQEEQKNSSNWEVCPNYTRLSVDLLVHVHRQPPLPDPFNEFVDFNAGASRIFWKKGNKILQAAAASNHQGQVGDWRQGAASSLNPPTSAGGFPSRTSVHITYKKSSLSYSFYHILEILSHKTRHTLRCYWSVSCMLLGIFESQIRSEIQQLAIHNYSYIK